jgi:hypothetical protein
MLKDKKKQVAVKMSKKAFIHEHKKLVADLKSGNKKRIEKQIKDQGNELKEYQK